MCKITCLEYRPKAGPGECKLGDKPSGRTQTCLLDFNPPIKCEYQTIIYDSLETQRLIEIHCVYEVQDVAA